MGNIYTPRETLSVRRYREVLLQTAGDQKITQPEWDSYVQLMVDDMTLSGVAYGGIQCSYTETPNANQRKQLIARLGEGNSFQRFAMVTGSALVRGAMTALRWAYRGRVDMRAFAPGEERQALHWLSEGTPFDVDEALSLLRTDAAVTGYTGLKK